MHRLACVLGALLWLAAGCASTPSTERSAAGGWAALSFESIGELVAEYDVVSVVAEDALIAPCMADLGHAFPPSESDEPSSQSYADALFGSLRATVEVMDLTVSTPADGCIAQARQHLAGNALNAARLAALTSYVSTLTLSNDTNLLADPEVAELLAEWKSLRDRAVTAATALTGAPAGKI